MKPHHRKSIRLKEFDYSQPGEYFVTICTKGRACTLGEIVDDAMKFSEIGKIVEACWREIPEHFQNARVNIYQIMPNHVHGIIQIKERTRRGEVPSPSTTKGDETSPLRKVLLGEVVYWQRRVGGRSRSISRTHA